MDHQRLMAALRAFARERDWDQYHTPKNLAMALSGEAGELLERFQWLTPEESARAAEDPKSRARIEEEMADVLLYLLRLADVLGVDLEQAAWHKLATNGERYPADQARGNARKYDELERG